MPENVKMYIFGRAEAKETSFTAGLKCKAVTHTLVFKQSGHYLSWHMDSEQHPSRTIITIIYKSAKLVIIGYSVFNRAKVEENSTWSSVSGSNGFAERREWSVCHFKASTSMFLLMPSLETVTCGEAFFTERFRKFLNWMKHKVLQGWLNTPSQKLLDSCFGYS